MNAGSPEGGPGNPSGNPLGVVAVIWSPVRTLREVARAGRALPGLLVVAAYAALGLLTSTILILTGVTRRQLEQGIGQQQTQPGLPPGFFEGVARAFEIAIPIISVFSPFVIWLLVSLFMQLVTRFFGGTGPLSAMLGVVGVSQVPFFVSGTLSILLVPLQLVVGAGEPAGVAIGYLSSLIGIAFFTWYVVLVVIGAAQARNIGYGESAGSCAISCVGIAVVAILVGVVVGIGVAVVLGATTS